MGVTGFELINRTVSQAASRTAQLTVSCCHFSLLCPPVASVFCISSTQSFLVQTIARASHVAFLLLVGHQHFKQLPLPAIPTPEARGYFQEGPFQQHLPSLGRGSSISVNRPCMAWFLFTFLISVQPHSWNMPKSFLARDLCLLLHHSSVLSFNLPFSGGHL